jgi:alanyl aminopeptidase
VLPCFDEPRFKTPFEIALVVPAGDVAISNGPTLAEAPLPEGRKRVSFAPTKPLPTYLLFVGVGPFEIAAATLPANEVRSEPLALRALGPRGRARELGYGLRAAGEMLAMMERWFWISYPYEKLDLIAAKTTPWSRQENTGAILFREARFLFDETRADDDQRRATSHRRRRRPDPHTHRDHERGPSSTPTRRTSSPASKPPGTRTVMPERSTIAARSRTWGMTVAQVQKLYPGAGATALHT